MVAQTDRRETESSTPVLLLGLLFIALGLAAIVLLLLNINATLSTRVAGEAVGATLLRFLNVYGIILPLIQLGIGIYLVQLGRRLMRGNVTAATWARQLFLWVVVAALVMIVQGFGAGVNAREVGSIGLGIGNALPWLIIGILAGAGYVWLGRNMHLFNGMETLAESSARVAWNLLVPTLLVLIFVALRPLEATFIYSLTDRRFASREEVNFVGLDNYANLLGFRFDMIECERTDTGACATGDEGIVFPRPRDVLDESYRELRFREMGAISLGDRRLMLSARDQDFFNAIGNTLTFTAASVTIELVLGLFIAMVINSKFAGRGLLRTAMLVPWAIPTVVSAKLWDVMLRDNQSGLINSFLLNLGLIQQSQAWLANPALQIPMLVAIDVWKTTPFMALILLAGLQTIPSDLYEAADVDGASKIRQFFTMTIPLLRPTIAVALVFRTLDAVRVFDVFQVLLERQQLSMATYNYYTLTNSQELGYASAIGVVIFIIILLFTIGYVRILGVSAE
jgi:trehalose/maltose transport system permease protein